MLRLRVRVTFALPAGRHRRGPWYEQRGWPDTAPGGWQHASVEPIDPRDVVISAGRQRLLTDGIDALRATFEAPFRSPGVAAATHRPEQLIHDLFDFAAQGASGWPSVAALLRTTGYEP